MRLADMPHEFAEWSRDCDPFYGRGVEWALWADRARRGSLIRIGTGESTRLVYVPRPRRKGDDRRPLPPDVLAGALQDPIHRKDGPSRPARSRRR